MKENRRTARRAGDISIAVSLLIFAWQTPVLHIAVIGGQVPAVESPRIKTLQDRLQHHGVQEVETFWRKVSERGAPLIESLPGDERHRLVTFLWRGQEDTKHVLIVGGVVPRWAYSKDSAEQKLMTRLSGTDVWYKTYRVRSDARVTYLLSPNDPLVEDKKSPTWQVDPLNPHRFEFKLDPENPQSSNVTPAVSVLSLPDAPPRRWTQPRDGVAHGKITETRIASTLLGNERRLWVYTPPGYRAGANRYPLLVLFDGWEYLHWIPTPTILDNLLAAGLIPPLVAVNDRHSFWARRAGLLPTVWRLSDEGTFPGVAQAIPPDRRPPEDSPGRFQPRGPRNNVLRVRESTSVWEGLVTVGLFLVAAATPLAKAIRE
jgi:enterochelin esterase family protein